jgi:hypothetical protein
MKPEGSRQKSKGSKHKISAPTARETIRRFFLLPTVFCLSEFIVIVVVIVQIFFLNDIQFDRIEADDLKFHSTFFAIHHLAFVHVEIHVNVGIAFWACSGRHFLYLQ